MSKEMNQPARTRAPTPRRVLFWVRRGLWIYALCAVFYLFWRFDLQSLPRDAITPLLRFHPGARLLVDRRNLDAREGQALLFHDEQGRLLLGDVGRAPESETRPGLWLLADNPEVQGLDSRTLGPIAKERVVGRVVCALPGT
ncbi:MAG TPA: S26 family signal peptidase [Planctomycetota bacterium]|nr:S26 family signal peptidase [Planctomycetota bacterium]